LSPPVPAVIEPLVARGYSVFLDLKLFDIPNTVAGAVRSATALGVKMMTLHAAGGPAMLAAAQERAGGRRQPAGTAGRHRADQHGSGAGERRRP
jgi:orotidine-5'-phosphate decarboxylase